MLAVAPSSSSVDEVALFDLARLGIDILNQLYNGKSVPSVRDYSVSLTARDCLPGCSSSSLGFAISSSTLASAHTSSGSLP